MSRLMKLYFIVLCFGVLILLFVNQSYTNYYISLKLNCKEEQEHQQSQKVRKLPPPLLVNLTTEMMKIIETERQRIKDEMVMFDYPAGMNNQPAQELADLTPETGGTPIRSIIITTWRSGSTFFGAALASIPSSYYHYEPLINFGIKQIRNDSDPQGILALSQINKFLQCDYSGENMENFLKFDKKNPAALIRNKRLWQKNVLDKFRRKPEFLTAFCRLFPLQVMKILRLRLPVAGKLLDDPDLNARIVLLIRDPRGVMQSRKSFSWCQGQPDCDKPSILCQNMEADYHAAQLLLKKYPYSFRVVRYEDLSLSPFLVIKQILRFYGLRMGFEVEQFLRLNTKKNRGDKYATSRDSNKTPFHWIKDLSYDEIVKIQNECSKAMDYWGYRKINNSSMLNDNFHPLLPYSLST